MFRNYSLKSFLKKNYFYKILAHFCHNYRHKFCPQGVFENAHDREIIQLAAIPMINADSILALFDQEVDIFVFIGINAIIIIS